MVKLSPEDEELNRKIRERFAAITQHFPSKEHLAAAFERSSEAILSEVKRVYPAADLYNVGPDMEERSDFWGCWIKVDTDERRDKMLGDDVFMHRLKMAGDAGGFPPCEITIESQETVDRSYEGSWFYRLR